MKKIVILPMPMQVIKGPTHYLVGENLGKGYDGATYYGINSILADKIKADDEFHIILLKTTSCKEINDKNTALFKQEFGEINKAGAKVEYVDIDVDFVETREEFQKIYLKLLEVFRKHGDGSELSAELTFGAKPATLMVFSLIQFANKFFDIDIKNVLYTGKDFNSPNTPQTIWDINFLVYLNSITNTMRCDTGDKAVELLNNFFGL